MVKSLHQYYSEDSLEDIIVIELDKHTDFRILENCLILEYGAQWIGETAYSDYRLPTELGSVNNNNYWIVVEHALGAAGDEFHMMWASTTTINSTYSQDVPRVNSELVISGEKGHRQNITDYDYAMGLL